MTPGNLTPSVAPANAVLVVDSTGTQQESRLWRTIRWLAGWSWRILAGAVLCFNLPYISYFTSILVVGWMNRWMRARVFDAWRKESPLLAGDDGGRAGMPMLLPRWFLPEEGRRTPSLWLNFKEGLATLFCVTLVMGWGCLLMLFSWEMGWIISFYKGYENAWIGMTVGVLGSLLLIVGLLYVPLARVHMAVTGEYRAFFEGRVIWQLIRARLLAFCGFVAVMLLAGVAVEVLKTAPSWVGNSRWLEGATKQKSLGVLREILFNCAILLFLAMLLTYGLAARVYRRALREALKKGLLVPDDLPPRLVEVLERLDLLPPIAERKRGLLQVLRWTWDWYTRRFLFAALLVMGALFVLKTYFGEFLNYHPFVGFMNHPLLQFPCVDYIPRHLL